MKTQKEVKRIEDKGAVILENRCIVMNRMLPERNMNVKGDLIRFQEMLLETGRKVILVIKW